MTREERMERAARIVVLKFPWSAREVAKEGAPWSLRQMGIAQQFLDEYRLIQDPQESAILAPYRGA